MVYVINKIIWINLKSCTQSNKLYSTQAQSVNAVSVTKLVEHACLIRHVHTMVECSGRALL